MTQDGLLIIRTVFTTIWTLFNGWKVPGTNVTPAAWALFILAAAAGIRHFKSIMNAAGGHSPDSGGKG